MTEVESPEAEAQAHRFRFAAVAGGFALVLIVSLVILDPAMPDRIALLTGPEGSAYHELGKRYAAELEKRGLETEVVLTAGGLDNIGRLASGAENTVAFAASRIEKEAPTSVDTSGLESLGSVGFEPLWLFHRQETEIERVRDLAGMRVETGGRGTIGDQVARLLIERNGIGGEVELLSPERLGGRSAAEALESGRVDAVIVTGKPEASIVGALLAADGLTFLSIERADAYAAHFEGVTKLSLPEGVLDLARNVPAEEAWLLSSSTSLIAREGLHPSIAPLFLVAAAKVQGGDSVLGSATRFPNGDNNSLPLSRSAQRYFDQGERGLSKHLPYRVTRYLNHVGFVVLPLLTGAFLLARFVPFVMRLYGTVRLVGLLKELESVEKRHAAGVDPGQLRADLDRIDAKSASMFVPRPTVHDYIDFRQFLHDMRERVEGGGGSERLIR